jgi:hypothetical protein
LDMADLATSVEGGCQTVKLRMTAQVAGFR